MYLGGSMTSTGVMPTTAVSEPLLAGLRASAWPEAAY